MEPCASRVEFFSRLRHFSPWHTAQQATLERVLILAGLDRSTLPITLVTVAPACASPGVEAWTSYDADGNGEGVFVMRRTAA